MVVMAETRRTQCKNQQEQVWKVGWCSSRTLGLCTGFLGVGALSGGSAGTGAEAFGEAWGTGDRVVGMDTKWQILGSSLHTGPLLENFVTTRKRHPLWASLPLGCGNFTSTGWISFFC